MPYSVFNLTSSILEAGSSTLPPGVTTIVPDSAYQDVVALQLKGYVTFTASNVVSAFSNSEISALRYRLSASFYGGAPASGTSLTGSTSEVTLADIVIPAHTVGTRGNIRVHTLWSCTNNANAKTGRLRLGGTQIASGSFASVATISGTSIIYARGSESSQACHPGLTSSQTSSGAAVTISSVDLTVDQHLTLTGQLGVGTDVMTLEGYLIEVLTAYAG